MLTSPVIEIGEDNAPALGQLEIRCANTTARMFAASLGDGRFAYAVFHYRSGGFEWHHRILSGAEINETISLLRTVTNAQAISLIETGPGGNPARELNPGENRKVYVSFLIVSHSGEIPCPSAPTDDEIYQLMSFLARCQPLA